MPPPEDARPATESIAGPEGSPLLLHHFGGRGPAALFVHATGFHGRIWSPVTKALSPQFDCWGVDLRGHGDSPMPTPPPVDWACFGRDVLAAAHHLGRPLIGVGHSLGAAALLMAELAEAGTFAALVLYEPAMPVPDTIDIAVPRAFAERTRRRRSTFASRAEAIDNFAAKPPTNELAPDVIREYVAHGFTVGPSGSVHIKCTPDLEAAIYEGAPSSTLSSDLHPLDCPVTLITGEHSEDLHGRSIEVCTRQLQAPVLVLAGAAHFGPLQLPLQFADLVRSILTMT